MMSLINDAVSYNYVLPRETFHDFEELFGSREIAEKYARAIEIAINAIEKISRELIEEKLEQNKIIIKEDLKNELVTRELFELRLEELRKEIGLGDNALRKDMKVMEDSIRKDMKAMEDSIRKDMKAMEISIRKDMDALETRMNEQFKFLNFKFNILIGLVLIALTFANPAFVKLLERLFF